MTSLAESAKRKLAGYKRTSYCVWEITLRCNLGCIHCGSRAGDARPNELTTEECLDVVRQLAEVGITEVTLIGGEAFLRPEAGPLTRKRISRWKVGAGTQVIK